MVRSWRQHVEFLAHSLACLGCLNAIWMVASGFSLPLIRWGYAIFFFFLGFYHLRATRGVYRNNPRTAYPSGPRSNDS